MADTFTAGISYGAVQRREPRITEIKFDDAGYSLRMARGMNSNPQIWDVPMNVVDIAFANNVENFMVAHGGVKWFWWTPPRSATPRKFICKRWSREPVTGSKTHDKITLTFEEVFDLAG
jgi:phage-related protein